MVYNTPLRTLQRLNIRCIEHLCRHLNCTEDQLWDFYYHPAAWYWRGKKTVKGKVRPIARPIGAFYAANRRLQMLLSRIALPPYLHGGIKGHSPRTNALVHIGKAAVLKFDLQDFFPRISPRQVYGLFLERLGCSPVVARMLTRLVTLNGGLPQGSPTSTVVANLVILPLAKRLNGLALSHESDYSQFVDDGVISGPGYIERLRSLIERIICEEGFRASPKPHKRLTLYRCEEQVVTGVKVNRRLDVPQERLRETREAITSVKEQIAQGIGPSEPQLRSLSGKIQHIRNLNARKASRLGKQLQSILSKSA